MAESKKSAAPQAAPQPASGERSPAAQGKPGGGQKKPGSAQAPIVRPLTEEVVLTKLMRDHTLREKVYLDRKIMLALGVCLGISVIANFLLATRDPELRYFATSGDGRLLPLTALEEPIQNVNEVLGWTTNAITQAYTFSFANYRQQLQAARPVFTAEGWTGFQKALEASGNLNAVITNKFVTTVVPRGAPVIVGEGYLNGAYAWKIQIPILVTYQSANSRHNQDLMVQLIVMRRSQLEHPSGLGIAQIIAE